MTPLQGERLTVLLTTLSTDNVEKTLKKNRATKWGKNRNQNRVQVRLNGTEKWETARPALFLTEEYALEITLKYVCTRMICKEERAEMLAEVVCENPLCVLTWAIIVYSWASFSIIIYLLSQQRFSIYFIFRFCHDNECCPGCLQINRKKTGCIGKADLCTRVVASYQQ